MHISASGLSEQNRYIAKTTVNGKDSLQSWIDSRYLQQPVELNLTLSATPNEQFGAAASDRPPSYGPQ